MGPLQNLLELICPRLTYDAYKVAQHAGDLVRLLGVEGLFAYKVLAFRRDLVHNNQSFRTFPLGWGHSGSSFETAEKRPRSK